MGVRPRAAEAQQSLVEELRRWCDERPLAPILVVVPSWLAAVQVRRRLASACGQRGHAAVRILPPTGLVHLLGAPAAAEAGLRPLPPWGFELLVHRAGEAAGGYFAPAVDRPGFVPALASTFRRLRLWGIRPERLRQAQEAAGDPREAQRWACLADIYERLWRRLAPPVGADAQAPGGAAAPPGPGRREPGGLAPAGRFVDEAALLGLAARAVREGVREGDLAARLGAGRVILWGVDDAWQGSPLWAALIEALGRAPGLSVDLRRPEAAVEAGQVPVRAVSCATELEEATFVARQVLDAAERGVPFWRMAVITRQADAGPAMLAQALDRAGVKAFSPGARTLDRTPAGRALLEWLALVEQGLARVALLDWLGQAPLRAEWLGVRPEHLQPAAWEHLSVKAGLAGDPVTWPERIRRLRSPWAPSTFPGGGSGGQAGGSGPAGGDADGVAEAFAQALETLQRELAAFPRRGRWADLAGAAGSWMDRALDPAAEGAVAVREAVVRLARLDELEDQLEAEGAEATVELLGRAAAAVLGGATLPEDARFERGTVAVLSAPQALGCAFDVVVVAGLVQSAFPASPATDPILSPRDLEQLGYPSPGEQARRHTLREDRLFAWAATSARQEVVLTRPRTEAAGGRDLLPSPFLDRLQQAGVLDDSRRLTPLAARFGEGAPEAAVVDFDVAQAHGRPGGPAGLGRWYPEAARGARARRARWGRQLTVYDGVIGTAPGDGTGGSFSPTDLEDYARCPRLYLWRRVLGLEAPGDPEESEGLVAAVRGSVAHGALRRFYAWVLGQPAAAHEPSGVAEPVGPWGSGHLPAGWRAALRQAIDEALAEEEPALGELGGVARLQADVLAEVLERFVQADAARWAADGMRPRRLEFSFGDVSYPLPDGDALQLRGRMDRLDAGDGPSPPVRVIDYKTGKPDLSPAQRLKGGLRLQPALYLWAACQLMRTQLARASAALVYLGTTTSPPSRVELPGAAWPAIERQLNQAVQTVTAGILAGHFPAWPHQDQPCSRCDFYALCGPEAARQTQRKQPSPQLEAIDRLRQEVT